MQQRRIKGWRLWLALAFAAGGGLAQGQDTRLDPADLIPLPSQSVHDVGQHVAGVYTEREPAFGPVLSNQSSSIAYYDATTRHLKFAYAPNSALLQTVQTQDLGTTAPMGQFVSIDRGFVQRVALTGDVVNGSAQIHVDTPLPDSVFFRGTRLEIGGQSMNTAGFDAQTSTLSGSTAYSGATTDDIPGTVTFRQPVIAFQDGANVRRLRVARPAGDGGWIFDVVDGPGVGSGSGFTGFDTSIASGSDGSIHVVYRDGAFNGGFVNALRYAVWDGTEWTYETPYPGSSQGSGAKIVLDANNAPAIFHRDPATEGRLLATFKQAPSDIAWTTVEIDANGGGLGISAAYDSNQEQLLVAHHEQFATTGTAFNRMLYAYGERDGASWRFTSHLVDEGPGLGLSASLDVREGSSDPTLVYYDAANKSLKGVHLQQSDSPTTAGAIILDNSNHDVGTFVSLMESFASAAVIVAYDATAKALVAYRSADAVTPIPYFIYLDGGGYAESSIAYGSASAYVARLMRRSPNLTVGRIEVAAFPLTGPQPATPSVYARIDPSEGIASETVKMAVDQNDVMYIAYVDLETTPRLKVAVVYPDATSHTAVIAGGTDGLKIGRHTAIALNDFNGGTPDRLAIAFYVEDGNDSNATYPTIYTATTTGLSPATNPGSFPLTFTVQPATLPYGDIGRFPSIAYDAGDALHLSYYDSGALAPGYTVFNPLGSVNDSVVIENDPFQVGGQETSLAINTATNRPAIAYVDITNSGLKVAELDTSGTWKTLLLDPNGDAGHSPTLRFDRLHGLALITYYDNTSGELRLARHSAGSSLTEPDTWRFEVLLRDTYGVKSSAAVLPDGRVALSLYEFSGGRLWAALVAPLVEISRASRDWLRLRE